ncbi:MAG TPA: O-acetyltransferase, partial [Leclercia adecarboxylata]|nr:O-acetyltransferase [Leclercia adecarboxylata]
PWPVPDIMLIFSVTVVISLLLSMALQRVDTKRFVS